MSHLIFKQLSMAAVHVGAASAAKRHAGYSRPVVPSVGCISRVFVRERRCDFVMLFIAAEAAPTGNISRLKPLLPGRRVAL